ncbi:TetR/AcrR family transcriptional regulator [Amycolatopsis sp. NPDC088138]|uniref:TetR/AcrR family transcriptional regulator n=1 Tax=Amycolatopsis sp. NPDC088138 TaxID=3363938 RepID=UPI00382212C9
MPEFDARIPARQSDLSTYARIRNAALEGFAARGVASTSIRDVAAAAGVSPGLVQHHFGTKAHLREAVDEYILDVMAEFSRELASRSEGDEAWPGLGDATTAWVRDNALALRYLARAMIDGDPAAARAFDALVGIARTSWLAPLDRAGALRPEADRDWAAIHAAVFNLASVLLEPAISRQLPEPFYAPAQLDRWNVATVDLYRNGLARKEDA